jgi:hypothetical protein
VEQGRAQSDNAVNGRAVVNGHPGSGDQGRPATGWAAVPTSGIPTVQGPGQNAGGAAAAATPANPAEPGMTSQDVAGRDGAGPTGDTPGRRRADEPHAAGPGHRRADEPRADEPRATDLGPDPRRADNPRATDLGPDPRRADNPRRTDADNLRASDLGPDPRRADNPRRTDPDNPRATDLGPDPRRADEHRATDLTPGQRRATEPRTTEPRTADLGPGQNAMPRAAEPLAPRRLASLADVDAAAMPRAGRRTADTGETPLRPGDVNLGQLAFWDEEAINHFRSQWHEIKAEFVDDPVAALTRAHDLLTDAVNELTESLLAERDELDPLRTTSAPDTESMRMAMRGYREFLDRILAL